MWKRTNQRQPLLKAKRRDLHVRPVSPIYFDYPGGKISITRIDVGRFVPVLKQLKLENICSHITAARLSNEKALLNKSPLDADTTIVPPIHCKIEGRILSGAYHLVYQIVFDDRVQWMLKIPANGYQGCWNPSDRTSLVSEANAMQYIKARTSIPVPTVYGFNGREGRSNPIGCPFILMKRMPGTQLAYLWFDKESTSEFREQLRARALQTIAAAMVQLNKIKAPQSGGLQLNPGGSFSNTVPAKIANPYRVGNNDEWCKKPASKNPAESLTFMNDRYPPISQSNMIEQGNRLFRRGLVDWAMQMTPIEDNKQFILTHTDFDLQNILVENDGTLYGVIDWDCAAAVPQHVGCLSYPKWLLKDRDPHHYHPGLDTQQRRALRVEPDSSPEELNHYRAIHAQFIERV